MKQLQDANGVDVAYRRAGAGPPLIYLHGMGLTGRWLPLYDELTQSFDVIVPDHPGFGDTARPAWYRSLDDFVSHYADFLNALGFDDVHVVGHSLGGRIAGSFAAIYPERLRSLTLITPAPLATVSPRDLLEPPSADALPSEFDIDSPLFNDNQAAYPEYRNGGDEGLVVATDDTDPHADPDTWSIEGSPTLYRRLTRVCCPTQVLVPDEDRVIPHECFDAWAKWLGDVPVIHVPGATHPTGHLLIAQEPAAIAARVVELANAAEKA